MRYRMHLSYDGTAFSGWQIQPSDRSIQGAVQDALSRITGEHPIVHASGRTDQGVHARDQVTHFDLQSARAGQDLKQGLNALLGGDVRVTRIARAPSTFHARKSAKGKEYRYFIWNDEIVPPFIRRYRTVVRQALDADAMARAASRLEGRHDFSAFTANPNRVVESTVRTLDRLTVRKRGNELVITAAGEGFLYKMVRSLAGFLIRVGEGALPPDSADQIRDSRERTARVPTAPPEGLFLWRVWY